MKKWISIAAVMVVFSLSGVVNANEGGACAKDAETLCKGVEKGEGHMMKCMHENADKVSSECKAQMKNAKETMKEVKDACHEDVQKFCADVEPGKGRMMKCMRKHRADLSEACKTEMKDARSKMRK